MGSYIASATTNIELIVRSILDSGKLPSPESLRIGLIAYRCVRVFSVWVEASDVQRGADSSTAHLRTPLHFAHAPTATTHHKTTLTSPKYGLEACVVTITADYLYSSSQSFGFSSDPMSIKEHLKTLYASGGGDGPEAVTAGMKAALELDWREGASKMTVLIADAPSHGIGE